MSDGSVQLDPAEIYFPVATQQMGLTADVLALLLMLIGLSRARGLAVDYPLRSCL